MSDDPQREMTLAEWVGRLYDRHAARCEYAALVDRCAKNEDVIKGLRDALSRAENRCTEAESGREYWLRHSEDMLARAQQAEASLARAAQDRDISMRKRAEAEAERDAFRDLVASGAVTEELLAGERDAARAEAARLRERWARAIEYACGLPTDGKVTGWTVLDALAALEGDHV